MNDKLFHLLVTFSCLYGNQQEGKVENAILYGKDYDTIF